LEGNKKERPVIRRETGCVQLDATEWLDGLDRGPTSLQLRDLLISPIYEKRFFQNSHPVETGRRLLIVPFKKNL
jgi:hypothetical protein